MEGVDQGNRETGAEALSQAYRRKASLFLLSSSQTPLLQSPPAGEDHPTTVACHLLSETLLHSNFQTSAGEERRGATLSDSVPNDSIDDCLICRVCGLLLQPGCNGTTIRLRSLKRGRTRRRRAGRYQAEQAVRDQQAPIMSGNGKVLQLEDEGCDSLKKRKREYEAQRVGDGASRHAVVYTCGQCASKIKFKGIPIAAQMRRQNMYKTPQRVNKDAAALNKKNEQEESGAQRWRQKQQGSNYIGHSFSGKNLKRPAPETTTSVLTPNKAGGVGMDGDFISIDGDVKSPLAKTSLATPTTKLRLLEQGSKRKTKKKKEEPKKKSSRSGLMDFLSSLND